MSKKDKHPCRMEQALIAYAPKPWRPNLPGVDYRIVAADLVPAMSGAIGKTALVAAFAMAWSVGLDIRDPSFVIDNVRLELVVGGIFTLLFPAFLNPSACPPGTLALLIPMVPLMASAGVHPLPFAVTVSLLGMVFALNGYFLKIVKINGPGTKVGVLLLFGLMGVLDSLDKLRTWAVEQPVGMVPVLVVSIIFMVLMLHRFRARWMVIPACACLVLAVAALFGVLPDMSSRPGLPIVSPVRWWNEKWGIGFGLTVKNFLTAAPFAMMVIAMWPVDALAVRAMQEASYPQKATRAYMDMKATFLVVVLRNITGAVLGGAQTSAAWRSFMIPLATIKRPIAGSALLLGVCGILFGLLGFLIDVGTYPPLVWLVLLLGVFVPMMETGLSQVRSGGIAQTALVCILVGLAVHPVLGWGLAMMTENLGLCKHEDESRHLTRKDKVFTVFLFAISALSVWAMK